MTDASQPSSRSSFFSLVPYTHRLLDATVLLPLLPILLALPRAARAVPAWSRKTGMACISCHVGGSSRLNDVGRDFQLRGHRLPGDAIPTRWDRSLLDYTSLALKMRSSNKESGPSSNHVQTAELFVGGPLTKKVSFFAEAIGYDRLSNGTSVKPMLQEAYVQYADAPDAKRFFWVRTGNLYPFAAYNLDGGGRLPLSRPRLISDRLSGLATPLLHRSVGVSSGYSGAGTHTEMGLLRGEGVNSARCLEQFVSVEQDFEPIGLTIGALGRSGWSDKNGDGDSPQAHRFMQGGLLSRWSFDRYTMTGAFLTTQARDASNTRRTGAGYLLETGVNLLKETTAFARYDNAAGTVPGGPRAHTVALGVTQRIQNTGRVVFEFADDHFAGRQQRSLQVDMLLLY